MNIYINACNLHISGGKVILNDLINAAEKYNNIVFTFYIDHRFEYSIQKNTSAKFKIVKKYQRQLVWHIIEKNIQNEDIVIYLTNIPPLLKHKCLTVLVQSNRFVIDKYNLKGFSLKTKIRINIERLLFNIGEKNADYIIVQSHTMSSILVNMGINKEKINVIAYKERELLKNDGSHIIKRSRDVFLYVSSGYPHKNHIKLIESWCLLSEENLYPKLILTIDNNTELFKSIVHKINAYNLNIEIMPKLPRNDLLHLYKCSTALIYPSLFESYGLPLVEAVHFNLPVIASELDYVRDILDPVETFDPNSSKSIFRAVKRFLNLADIKTEIVDPHEFIGKVINYV